MALRFKKLCQSLEIITQWAFTIQLDQDTHQSRHLSKLISLFQSIRELRQLRMIKDPHKHMVLIRCLQFLPQFQIVITSETISTIRLSNSSWRKKETLLARVIQLIQSNLTISNLFQWATMLALSEKTLQVYIAAQNNSWLYHQWHRTPQMSLVPIQISKEQCVVAFTPVMMFSMASVVWSILAIACRTGTRMVLQLVQRLWPRCVKAPTRTMLVSLKLHSWTSWRASIQAMAMGLLIWWVWIREEEVVQSPMLGWSQVSREATCPRCLNLNTILGMPTSRDIWPNKAQLLTSKLTSTRSIWLTLQLRSKKKRRRSRSLKLIEKKGALYRLNSRSSSNACTRQTWKTHTKACWMIKWTSIWWVNKSSKLKSSKSLKSRLKEMQCKKLKTTRCDSWRSNSRVNIAMFLTVKKPLVGWACKQSRENPLKLGRLASGQAKCPHQLHQWSRPIKVWLLEWQLTPANSKIWMPTPCHRCQTCSHRLLELADCPSIDDVAQFCYDFLLTLKKATQSIQNDQFFI